MVATEIPVGWVSKTMPAEAPWAYRWCTEMTRACCAVATAELASRCERVFRSCREEQASFRNGRRGMMERENGMAAGIAVTGAAVGMTIDGKSVHPWESHHLLSGKPCAPASGQARRFFPCATMALIRRRRRRSPSSSAIHRAPMRSPCPSSHRIGGVRYSQPVLGHGAPDRPRHGLSHAGDTV